MKREIMKNKHKIKNILTHPVTNGPGPPTRPARKLSAARAGGAALSGV
jgi:hypothetical protein